MTLEGNHKRQETNNLIAGETHGVATMKRTAIIFALIILTLVAPNPAAAQNRYIVRTTGGLSSVLNLCNLLQCQVQGSLDGPVGQNFLVTSSNNLLVNLVNGTLNLVESLLGIVSVEADRLLPIPQPSLSSVPSGLYDTAPVNYYGSVVWHGYAAQPATQIIRLQDAQNGFRVAGTGIVAVIDTGVDIKHPVLTSVLLPGYDFTRNQPGASEWLDVAGMQNGYIDTNTQNQQPVYVQQSTAAVLDQSTAAVLDGTPYTAFGHGTMTSGLVHLVAPQAKILPLKAFSSDGTGYLSNIVAALYYAVQHHANVVNMSFDLTSPPLPIGTAGLLSQITALRMSGSLLPERTSSALSPAGLMRAPPELPSAPRSSPARYLFCSAPSRNPSINRRLPAHSLMDGLLHPTSIKGVSMPIRQSLHG